MKMKINLLLITVLSIGLLSCEDQANQFNQGVDNRLTPGQEFNTHPKYQDFRNEVIASCHVHQQDLKAFNRCVRLNDTSKRFEEYLSRF